MGGIAEEGSEGMISPFVTLFVIVIIIIIVTMMWYRHILLLVGIRQKHLGEGFYFLRGARNSRVFLLFFSFFSLLLD